MLMLRPIRLSDSSSCSRRVGAEECQLEPYDLSEPFSLEGPLCGTCRTPRRIYRDGDRTSTWGSTRLWLPDVQGRAS